MYALTLSGHVPIGFRNWAPKTNAKRILNADETEMMFARMPTTMQLQKHT